MLTLRCSRSCPNVNTRFKIPHSELVDLPLINVGLIHLPSSWQGQNSVSVDFKLLVIITAIPCLLPSRHTVLSPWQRLTCWLFIVTRYGRCNHYCHCADNRTGQEMVSNLPKITQLIRGRPRIEPRKPGSRACILHHYTVCTFQVRCLHSKISLYSQKVSRRPSQWIQAGKSCSHWELEWGVGSCTAQRQRKGALGTHQTKKPGNHLNRHPSRKSEVT